MKCNFWDNTGFKNVNFSKPSWVTFSEITDLEMANYKANSYSIKYVMQGSEHYVYQNRRYIVGAGRFLLVNREQPLDLFIKGKKKARAYCIHLNPSLVQQIYTEMQHSAEALLDRPFEYLALPDFEQVIYSDKENSLGSLLRELPRQLDASTSTIPVNEEEWYYRLGKALLQIQHQAPKTTPSLGVIRNSTSKELLRRLSIAREMLESNCCEPLQIATIAQTCMLSESHLFRSFKKVYGISPHQYMLQKRLDKAAGLIRTGAMQVQEVAATCGFADLASFSKAFKKAQGMAPTRFGGHKRFDTV